MSFYQPMTSEKEVKDILHTEIPRYLHDHNQLTPMNHLANKVRSFPTLSRSPISPSPNYISNPSHLQIKQNIIKYKRYKDACISKFSKATPQASQPGAAAKLSHTT